MSAFNRADQPGPASLISKVLGSHRQEILERGLAPALAEILGYLLQRRWRLSIFLLAHGDNAPLAIRQSCERRWGPQAAWQAGLADQMCRGR